MNPLPLLTDFIRRCEKDDRLLPSHICTYLALFWLWKEQGFCEHLTIFRKDVMLLAKIGSIVTYHKAIRDLDNYGYIHYLPTYNYYHGSRVYFLKKKQPQVPS